MGFSYNVNVLNQKGSPAIYTDTFANRPAPGFEGRLFVANDTSAIYEDTGTAWILIANVSSGAGTLQQVTTNGNTTDKGISISALGLSTNTLTVTSLTPGSVAFVGAADLITEDNANLFWDDTNNRLGINTNTPGNSLDVHYDGTNAILALNNTAAHQTAISFLNSSVAKWHLANKGITNDFEIYNFNLILIAMSVKSTDNTVYIANSLGINNSAPAYNLDVNGTSLLGGAVAILGTNNQNYLQITGVTTGYSSQTLQNTGGLYLLGLNGSAAGAIQAGASAYATVLNASKNLELFSGNVKRLTLDETTGQATFTQAITAGTLSKFWDGTQGLFIGAYTGGANYGAIYPATITPGAANFSIAAKSGATTLNVETGGFIDFEIAGATKMIIFNTGNVAIGGLTDDTVRKLQVNGSASIKDYIRLTPSATISVSTVATTISPIANTYGGLAIVWGAEAGSVFTDLIFYSLSTTFVINSQNVSGAPSARVYTSVSGDLKLAMALGTYTVFYQATLTQ